jgi:hypothetical protein
VVCDTKEVLVYFLGSTRRLVTGLIAVKLKHREIGVEVKMFKSHNF